MEKLLPALQQAHHAQGNEVIMASSVEVAKPGAGTRLVTFYHDVVAEMKKVTWPDRAQLQ